MIGIVVSGHGHFASGLTSALMLLAGETEALQVVDFEAQDSIEILEGKMKAAIEALDSTDGIMIMTDLQGGSPFNVALRLAMMDQNLEVVTGTNLPMLVDAYMSRPMFDGAAELAASVVAQGKNQVILLEKPGTSASDDDDELEID